MEVIVKSWKPDQKHDIQDELAWKLAEVASDPAPILPEVTEMVINRVIDNVAVAVAALERAPVAAAMDQALAFGHSRGGTLIGLPSNLRCQAPWAGWANGVAVRELDFHDTFLAQDYSHPADNIPHLIAVAQQMNRSGWDLIRGIVAAYEVHVSLVKSICLHEFKKDHIAHLAPAVAAGIGALLQLPTPVIYQAINHAVHVSFTTRQGRKGQISSWKAYAPAHAGKLAIEAVDRAMRGQKSPAPIYEGADSVIAWMLKGPEACYRVVLPDPGQARTAILETYTKEHSAEYQAQALIDLAFRMRQKISNFDEIEKIIIYTSHHTHYVIGSGSQDPQKYDPNASRETLDHSIMYIFTVALQDGRWHHIDSYRPERAHREDTVRLWQKVITVEDPAWTQAYHHPDPMKKKFGGRVEILFKNGQKLVDEIAVANAHPAGAKPFQRPDYIRKFLTLTEGYLSQQQQELFLERVQKLPNLKAEDLIDIYPFVDLKVLPIGQTKGIF